LKWGDGMKTALATVLASVLVTSVAHAQPSSAPAPAPAPAVPPPTPIVTGQPVPASEPPPPGSDGTDVSHINGQLVKVGEHNEYYYTFRRTNLSANPLGWVLGIYGASVSYGFSQNVAIRGDVNFFAPPDTDVRGMELGVGLPIYLRRTYQGPFLEPGFIARSFRDGGGDDVYSQVGPQVLVGWHWSWDSGLNFAIAGGLGRNWSNDEEYEEDIFPNGYMRFGYAF
jgi:hypothetical protein